MIECLGFFAGEGQNLFHSRRVRNVADHLCLGSGADLFLDFHPNRLEIETHLLQDIHCHTLPQFDQAEQQMLGANIIVVEPVSFFPGQRQDLLRARCKIIHCSMRSNRFPCP